MDKIQIFTLIHDMVKLRISQMIVNEEYKLGKFKVPIHLGLGHESIAVAIHHLMDENDRLVLSHRNIEFNLARLGKLKPILDEYFLKTSGLMQGKLGSMNLINPKKGIIYTSSILGNNFSVGTGIAMSQKISSINGITIILGGDGSIEEGSFHESLLMLKSLGLSALVIIENNEWSLGTRIDERRAPIYLDKLSQAYDIKFKKLHGNDPVEYLTILNELKNYSLVHHEPVCVEVMLSTLGDWIMNAPGYPNGKFVNYHAGPTPSVSINDNIIIKNSSEDPLHVIQKYISKDELVEISKMIKDEITGEIK